MTKRLTIALVAVALFVLMAVMPVSAAVTNGSIINQGATVFIGEEGLNLTHFLNQARNATFTSVDDTYLDTLTPVNKTIGWWASAASITASAPTKTIDLSTNYKSMTIDPVSFGAYTGNWYVLNGTTAADAGNGYISVQDPSLTIAVWDFNQGLDVTGKSVPQGEALGFKINTNMYSALDGAKRFNAQNNSALSAGNYQGLFPTLADGYITIYVKDANGAQYASLQIGNLSYNNATSLAKKYVNTSPWTLGTLTTNSSDRVTFPGYWVTDATDFNNQYLYPVGTYSAWAESTLNRMKYNYKNAGADYTGKTVSATGTITLVSDTVKIEANKDSVVRSKTFSVTVTGKPATFYYVWVKGTSAMNSAYDNQPPMVNINQELVYMDVANNATGLGIPADYPIGGYSFENAPSATPYMRQDVATTTQGTSGNDVATYNSTRYYAKIKTSSSGTRTVEFTTNNWTKAQKYTIRVENNPSTGVYKSDEVDVKVEKGAVTIVAAGDQSYYLGEEIKFSGTNTESYKTYLFISGPNLPTQGAQIQGTNPRSDATNVASGTAGVEDGNAASFKSVDVNGDNTWSWKWGTSAIALDAGTYTIYAVSQPRTAASNNLANTAFGTVSIIIKKPFVSATASQSTVAQGDKIFITGTAQGNPTGVKIWILGKNYPTDANGVKDESVNADASFKYEVTQATTKNLYPGQYFVVVQHPMQNNVFDIRLNGNDVWNYQSQVTGVAAGSKIFALLGAGSLQGSDAAEALVQGINDPNVDDTYTKLQFLVEVPVIRIDPIGDKHVGDKFTITASTNLAVDDEVLIEVYSSSFKPTQKSQSGEFSGATGTVKVTKGDSGMNKLSFDVDSSTFKPDEYIVTEDAILQVATATALFNVLEGAAPVVTTKAPVVTTVAPVVTTAAPVVTTAVPVTTTPKPAPGYGALIALIGLGAVAFIVVRRH
ncbi:MAG: MEMAR_RS02690 family S-layer glycoprotein [Methanoregula sp.]